MKLNIFERAGHLLSLSMYARRDEATPALGLPDSFNWSMAPDEQYVLRMMIRSPKTHGFVIPPALLWSKSLVEHCYAYHSLHFPPHAFWYLTVRNGSVKSATDDVWHVDGFSLRTPHLPEQNFLLTDSFGTQVLDGHLSIPQNFDAFRHNIHHFFSHHAHHMQQRVLAPNLIHCIDPYVIHRRDPLSTQHWRKFLRISAIPVQIEDDTCMPNPLLPPEFFNRKDIRHRLIDYYEDPQIFPHPLKA